MAKVAKTLSLDKEVCDDIESRSLNFSEWVQTEYVNQFMSEAAKRREIGVLKEKIASLEKEIEENKERAETLQTGLTEMEKRFMLEVPRLISEGAQWNAILRRFNNTFKKEYDLGKFKKTVKYLGDQRDRKAQKLR